MMHLLRIIFLLAVSWVSLSAQVIFYEDFQNGIPATFTLVNADGKIPATQVAFVNEAWVTAAYGSNNDSAAVSTSWYNPPATADDWLITPSINLTANATLSWKAFASDPDFRDGYEVRISTAGNSTADFTTILFSTGAEQVFPVFRSVDLTPYAGQSVYLAFRNNSFNKNLLFIDDIKVELKPDFDLAVQSAVSPTEFTLLPRAQQKTFIPSATVKNEGINTLSNAKVFAALFRNALLVKTDSQTVSLLPSGLVSTVNFSPFATSDTGAYELLYFTRISSPDGNTSNDTAKFFFNINDTIYARDRGLVTGSVSIGASQGEFGHVFEVVHPARVKSATVFLKNPSVGSVTKFRLYQFGTSPGAIVDSTITYTTTLSDSLNGKTLNLSFIGGNKLAAGKYLLAVVEQGSKKLNVGATDEVQSAKANWYRYFGNPFFRWANGEEYDSLSASQAFTKVFALRLNFENACKLQPDFGFVTKPTCSNTGSVSVNYSSENKSPYQYQWTAGQTSSAINNLIPGIYAVTVTDAFGCKFSASDTVKNIPITLSIQVKDVSCKGGANGTATANPTGGNGNYTYVWNTVPQQVGKTASGLKQGVYTVTVTDGSCVSTSIAPVLEPSVALTVNVTQRINPSSSTSSDGKISVSASGGASPYLYVWGDSSVQQTLENIPAGKYCVTVTDSRECSVEKCDTIGIGVSVHEISETQFGIFPQPASSHISVEFSGSNYSISLLDMRGAILQHHQVQEKVFLMDVSAYPTGVYIMQLSAQNAVISRKVVIAR